MAARALLGWLDDENSPRLCVVTGSPGSGKSHLLAWLYAASGVESTPSERRIHAFVPVRELTLHSVVLVLAGQLGVAARTPRELVNALAGDPRRTVIAVVDIGAVGAHPDQGRHIVAELLDPLLELPHVRVVVECADPAVRAAFTRPAAPAVLDLDETRWTDPDRFERWYTELLTASPFASPFGAGDVYPHPGLARLAARVDGSRVAGLPDEAAAWSAQDKASHVRNAWWASVSEAAQPVIATLSGLGAALTYEQWETAYRTLDGAEDPRAASAVARAALYLPTVGADPRTWQLSPGPLAAFVAARAPQVADPERPVRVHAALRRAVDGAPAAAPAPDAPAGRGADEERITAILDHSVRIGDAATFVADPVVQAAARPHSVISALVAGGQWEDARHAAFREASPALIEEPDPAARAALLRLHLLGRDDAAAAALAERAAEDAAEPAAGPGWTALWARWRDEVAATPDYWPGPVLAAGAGRGGFAGRVLLVDPSGVIRAVDAADGSIGGRVGTGGPVPLRAVASTLGGRVATLNRWGGVDVVDAAYHGPRGALEAAFERLVNTCAAEPTALCAHPLPAIGDDRGGVWWYGSPPVAEGGEEVPRGIVSAPMHTGPVTALAAVRLDAESGLTLLISGGADGRIRLWSPGAEPMSAPLDERPSAVTAVAAEHTTAGPIIAAAWADGLIRVRRTEDNTVVDLRLGSPVHGIGVTPDGTIVLGGATGVVGIRLTDRAS